MELMWPAGDIVSISMRNQTDGYMVVRPELTQHDEHTVSISHFSFKTKTIDTVNLVPQVGEKSCVTACVAFSAEF